jgi:hypothetical protein
MPEAVKEPGEAGVKAALEHWWEAAYYLQQTGDSHPIEEISASSCIICEDVVSDWTEIYEAGGWSTGSNASVSNFFVTIPGDEKDAAVVFETVEDASSLYKPDGSEVDPDKPGESFRTGWSGNASFDSTRGHWVIKELVVQGDLDGVQ